MAAEILVAAGIALAGLAFIALVEPVSWARLFGGVGRWGARRVEDFSPRLARWYESEPGEDRDAR